MLGSVEYRRHPTLKTYFVSSDGFVFNTRKGWNIVLSRKNNRGYLHVSIWNRGSAKFYSVHRLVADTFLNGWGEHVNHKDLNKQNNSVSNLELCSMSYNMRHKHFGKKRFVSRQHTNDMFYIRIKDNGKYLYTPGQFSNIDEAYAAARNYYINHFGFEPWSLT